MENERPRHGFSKNLHKRTRDFQFRLILFLYSGSFLHETQQSLNQIVNLPGTHLSYLKNTFFFTCQAEFVLIYMVLQARSQDFSLEGRGGGGGGAYLKNRDQIINV